MSSVDFKSVRDSYSLAYFFEGAMGATSKKVSGSVRYSACPNCGASSDASVKVSVQNEKWHCFSCEEKGDVIDAAAAFFGVSLADAAVQLSSQDITNLPQRQRVSAPVPRVERDQGAINLVITKLLDAQRAPDSIVVEYLQSRGIPQNIAEWAVGRQVMITLPGDPNDALRYLLDVVGRELLEQSGIWKKDSKCPAIVYRPLAFVSANQHGIEFRLIGESAVAMAKAIRYGEPAPCRWEGNEHVMITEGGIDMLSAVVLGSERTIYSVPGANNWQEDDEWLVSLQGHHVMLSLDADSAGNQGADGLMKVLRNLKSKISRHSLPDGCKDLNDQLRMTVH
jgi:5S rRNA maturation endonuclease (ribonuclease M5)